MTINEIDSLLEKQDWYLNNQDWDSAIAASTVIIGLRPATADLFQAYLARGYARCFVSAKDDEYAKAVEDLSMAIAILPRAKAEAEAEVENKTAEAAENKMKIPDAVDAKGKMKKLKSIEPECYAKRAYSYWLSSKYERAIADCEKVKELAGPTKSNTIPADIEAFAYELLSQIYTNTGYPIEAAKYSKEALQLQPASVTLCGFTLLEQYRLACKRLKGN